MIRTQQTCIPWLWGILVTTTTGVNSPVESVSRPAMTFSLKKFISDPALITFIGSINIAFNSLVAPYTAWKSDRIWTRWGRRKPYLLVGWSISLGFAPAGKYDYTSGFLYVFAVDVPGCLASVYFQCRRRKGEDHRVRTTGESGH